jgi:hypothetical protein
VSRFEAEVNRLLGVASHVIGSESVARLSEKLERLDFCERQLRAADDRLPQTVPTGSAELAAVRPMHELPYQVAVQMRAYLELCRERLKTAVVRDDAQVSNELFTKLEAFIVALPCEAP